MARARNIKPALFDNDLLADNDPLGRLLFIGLWTIADYNGNLEWRPRRIKKEILAYDDCCIEELAINLDKSGFIRFYSVQGSTYLNIVNFSKHQNPHKNEKEKGTEIPEYKEELRQAIDLKGITINRDKSGINQEHSTSDPADSLFLIPDSLSLIPDSLSLIPDSLNPDACDIGLQEGKQPAPTVKKQSSSKKKSKAVDSAETWRAYSDAYFLRYGVEPIRNAKVNSQLAAFCRSVPIEEAPHIARFYVQSNNQFYVTRGHPVGHLKADAEKLCTEWRTGRAVTATQARDADRMQSMINVVEEANKILENSK